MKFRRVVAAFAFLLAASAVSAQPAPPTRIRGVIDTVGATGMTVNTREGSKTPLVFDAKLLVAGLRAIDLDSIGPGKFVGVAAVKGADGNLHALEVHVFPESMRGVGEGHYDWDLTPGSSMTNATVTALVSSSGGHKVRLHYMSGTLTIDVGPEVPVVEIVPGTRDDLKPGAAVFVIVKAGSVPPDAVQILVENNGVAPSM